MGTKIKVGKVKIKVGLLYHVTFVNRLGTIAGRGLLPIRARQSGFSAGGVVDHDKGKVYFTGPDGIRYWYARAEVTAVGRSHSPIDEGYVPVVLLVRCLPIALEPDPLGEKESRLPAFMASDSVAPKDISLWTGSDWASLDEHAGLDPTVAVRGGIFLPCASNPLANPSTC